MTYVVHTKLLDLLPWSCRCTPMQHFSSLLCQPVLVCL